jgi:hypothetical protein
LNVLREVQIIPMMRGSTVDTMRTFVTALLVGLSACHSNKTPVPMCREPVCLVEKRARGRIFFEVFNNNEADVTAVFDVTFSHGRASTELPVMRVVAPRHKLHLTALSPELGVVWRYAGNFRYVYGSAWAHHTPRSPYALPYAPGEARRVMQGWRGGFTHIGDDEFAVDFEMPAETPVRAAREGIAVLVKDDSAVGCADVACVDAANYMLVRHPEGSVAAYGHLAHRGARVRAGEQVARGQVIALSGATGRVTAPHFHFVVRVARDDATWQSVPVTFEHADGTLAQPIEGAAYSALP